MNLPVGEKKVWQYKIPNTNREGWASIMLREDGFFAAVSDYGNYAYYWGCTGCEDVREFFLGAHRDWDYFAGKFNPRKTIDDEKSFENLKRHLLEEQQELKESDELCVEEHLAEIDEKLQHLETFSDWDSFLHDDGTPELFEEPWEWGVLAYDPDVVSFAKKVMPRLEQLIRAELAREAYIAVPRRVRMWRRWGRKIRTLDIPSWVLNKDGKWQNSHVNKSSNTSPTFRSSRSQNW